MNAKNINLISVKKEQTAQEVRLRLFLAKFTPLVVVVTICVGIVVFVGDWFANRTLSRQSTQIQEFRNNIAENESQEGMYMAVLQKATILQKILGSRIPYAEFLSYLRTFAVDDTSIQSVELNDKQELSITLSAGNSDSIQRVISSIEEKGNTYFGEAELTSVVQSGAGYDITFTFRDLKVRDIPDTQTES